MVFSLVCSSYVLLFSFVTKINELKKLRSIFFSLGTRQRVIGDLSHGEWEQYIHGAKQSLAAENRKDWLRHSKSLGTTFTSRGIRENQYTLSSPPMKG